MATGWCPIVHALKRRARRWRRRALEVVLRWRGANVGAFETLSFEAVDVLSLDVFDTCIGRAVWSPTDIFFLAAAAVGDGDPSSAVSRRLAEARIKAESAARQRTSAPDVSLAEIYAEPEFVRSVDDELRNQLQQAEIAIEKRYSLARADTKRAVERARIGGKRVLYLSDMYLPTSVVSELLEQAKFPRGAVEVSGETGMTKADGSAFAALVKQTSGCRVLHVGDNTRADGVQALAAGLNVAIVEPAQHIYRSQPLDYQLPDDAPLGDGIVWSLAAHTALSAPSDHVHPASVAWRTGATALGPLVAAFAAHLVADLGDDTVAMFASRDMRFVEEIYAALCPGRRHHYLELSRRSVGLPALAGGITLADREFLIGGRGLLTERQLWSRLGIELPRVFPDCDRPLAQLDRDGVWQHFLEYEDLVVDRAQSELDEFVQYWRRSGFPLDGSVTLVDVGWRATVQRALRRCLQLGQIEVDLRGTYLALLDVPPADAGPAQGWIVDGGQPASRRLSFEAGIPIVELAFQADEGTVVNYRDGAACRGPRVDPRAIQEQFQLGARAVCRRWLELDPPAHPTALSVLPMLRLLSRPTVAEARTLGRMLHTDRVGTSDNLASVLPPPREARRALLSRNGWTAVRSSEWRPGLLASAGVPPLLGSAVDAALRAIKLVGRLVARLRSGQKP